MSEVKLLGLEPLFIWDGSIRRELRPLCVHDASLYPFLAADVESSGLRQPFFTSEELVFICIVGK